MRISVFLILALPLAAQAGPINDTGIDFCRKNGSDVPVTPTTTCNNSQDARYGRDAAASRGQLTKVGGGHAGFDFTKVANNGSTLPASAILGGSPTEWACTYDNTTGLLWEVKTLYGLRSQDQTYSWYDSVHNYLGAPGTPNGGTCAIPGNCDTEKFVAYVNAQGLCGHSDWRMPTTAELLGVIDFGMMTETAHVDSDYFPNLAATFYWTATPFRGSSTQAWYVRLVDGFTYVDFRSAVYQVLLVRSGR